MREKALSLFYFLMCLTIWAPIYVITEFSPGKLGSSGHLHLLTPTHLDMLYLKIGKCKCIHKQCKKWEWETPSSFVILGEKKLYRQLLLQEKQMNERVRGVLITYHGSRLKCQCFCSPSEQLKCFSGFWLGKGRYLKRCELHAHDTFSEANHTLSNQ